MKKGTFLPAFLLLVIALSSSAQHSERISLTILYDNYSATTNTKPDWGFSCLIEGMEKDILFDAGQKGNILLQNMENLNIGLERFDLIVISHDHRDHNGGLFAVLKKRPEVPVWFGASIPEGFGREIAARGATPVLVSGPVEICKNVFSTGEMAGVVNEQSLIIDTDSGLVVVTGCAHPGILDIVKKAKEIFHKDVYWVMGGFHLLEMNDDAVRQIIRELEDLGVKKCGASHCTGDKAIELFKKAYGDNYVPLGTGMVIEIPDHAVAKVQ